MSRPHYENRKSLQKEHALAQGLEKRWECKLKKLPIKYMLDYAAWKNKQISAWVELKCRTIPFEQYDEYMISLAKVMAAKELSRNTGLQSFLVVQWSNKTAFLQLDNADYELRMGGRKDRNDPDDIEPCCYFKLKDFTDLELG
jgi:hypothetical protein